MHIPLRLQRLLAPDGLYFEVVSERKFFYGRLLLMRGADDE